MQISIHDSSNYYSWAVISSTRLSVHVCVQEHWYENLQEHLICVMLGNTKDCGRSLPTMFCRNSPLKNHSRQALKQDHTHTPLHPYFVTSLSSVPHAVSLNSEHRYREAKSWSTETEHIQLLFFLLFLLCKYICLLQNNVETIMEMSCTEWIYGSWEWCVCICVFM